MFRDSHIPRRSGAHIQSTPTPSRSVQPKQVGAAAADSRTASSSAVRAVPWQPARRPETGRLGVRCNGRPIQPAALRVLETTWRVWREPPA